MRTRLTALAVALILAAALPVPSARAQLKLPRVSPAATVTQTLGITDLTVAYCRPGVKGRVIWGGLVPYGQALAHRRERGDALHHHRRDPVRTARSSPPAPTRSSPSPARTSGSW